MSTQKILKVGNSLGVTLPSSVVKKLSLKAGDTIEVLQDSSSIILNLLDSHQLSLELPKTSQPGSKKI